MQQFEPDQLVLVKYAGNNKIWRLKRYSFCIDGYLHETQDGATYICAACNAIPELVNTIRDMEKAIANMGIMIAAAYKNQTSEGGGK